MSKLQENAGQYFVSVPKLLVKKKGWTKGKELLWTFNEDGNLTLMSL